MHSTNVFVVSVRLCGFRAAYRAPCTNSVLYSNQSFKAVHYFNDTLTKG